MPRPCILTGIQPNRLPSICRAKAVRMFLPARRLRAHPITTEEQPRPHLIYGRHADHGLVWSSCPVVVAGHATSHHGDGKGRFVTACTPQRPKAIRDKTGWPSLRGGHHGADIASMFRTLINDDAPIDDEDGPTRHALGCHSKRTMEDFPAPLGPTTPTRSPGANAKVRPSSAAPRPPG